MTMTTAAHARYPSNHHPRSHSAQPTELIAAAAAAAAASYYPINQSINRHPHHHDHSRPPL